MKIIKVTLARTSASAFSFVLLCAREGCGSSVMLR